LLYTWKRDANLFATIMTDDDPVRAAAAQAIRTLDLQQTLPHDPVAGDSGWNWHIPIPEELLWAAAIIIVGLILYYIWESVQGTWFGQDDPWRTEGLGPAGAPRTTASSLAAADDLAGQGRFVEAMHLLLLHSLAELRRGLKVELADSLTSREIVRLARLPDRGRGALDRIVARVESSWFGDHPASRDDYDSCRAGFEELAHVLDGARTV
jgi:hypothetical protein